MSKKLTRTERILEPFGPLIGNELIKFFNLVSQQDVDAIVFMARKSICVFNMMIECGIERPKAKIYTDAILYSHQKELEGKKVLIVDDTLFVGTSLNDAKVMLNGYDNITAHFWVFCADDINWDKKIFEPEYLHKKLNPQQMIEFCAAECRSLINAGIPYLTDFSATEKIRLTENELDYAVKPHNWYFHDVSSQYHSTCRVRYYSAFPDSSVHHDAKSLISSQLVELIEITKIRAFCSWTGNSYETTFVPVITFGSMHAHKVKGAAVALFTHLQMSPNTLANSSPEECLRCMQFIVGAVYLKSYIQHLTSFRNIKPNKLLDQSWCYATFHKPLADEIVKGINAIYQNDIEAKKPKSRVNRTSEPEEEINETKLNIEKFLEDYFSSKSEIDFRDTPLSDLTAIFLEFHSTFENKAREEIRNNEKNPKFRDRLKLGMAWEALSGYLLNKYRIKNGIYQRNILSLVLDRLVDFGIAVPIIAKSSGKIYRAYRHGEDVRFGAQEESLVYKTLAGFTKARKQSFFEGIYFEKLIVILLRVGMNEEWLNLWYSNSGADTYVRVGFSLQGAVPIAPSNMGELLPEGKHSWLSRRLCKSNIISIDTPEAKQKKYRLNLEPEAAHAKRDSTRNATLIGITIGTLCTKKGETRTEAKPLTTDDLIILTSCSNLIDTSASVAAEKLQFSNWYENGGRSILLRQSAQRNNLSLLSSLRNSYAKQAVNSGLWKIKKFREEEIDKIKEKIYNAGTIEENETYWAASEQYWEAIFEAFQRDVNEKDTKKLDKLLISSHRTLTRFNQFILALELLILDRSHESLSKSASNIRAQLSDHDLNIVDTNASRHLRNLLSNVEDKKCLSRQEDSFLSQHIDVFVRNTIHKAMDDVNLIKNTVLNTEDSLSKTIYRFMIWYDIIDVRVRQQNSIDGTQRYSDSIDNFRSTISSMLADSKTRIHENGGAMLSEAGDIASINDEKHIFLAGKGAPHEEGLRLISSIIKIANQTGIKIRILATHTNIRGDYVSLNKGQTSIDGDYKSHIHTIIQSIKGHELESALDYGESLLWLVDDTSRHLALDELIDIKQHNRPMTVGINIKSVKDENIVHAYTCTI